MDDDKQKGLVFGAFIGDSHALGAHWVYNTRAIDKKTGRVTELIDPIVKTFHPNKKAGDLTHYGDQMLLFLEHISSTGKLNRKGYLETWTQFFDSYGGYKDHAMKETRENIGSGKENPGSGSTDLAGTFYVPVLLYFSGSDEEQLAADIESAVTMTHNSPPVLQAARFFSALLREVLRGTGPIEAIDRLLDSGSYEGNFSGLVTKGIESIGDGTRETIKEFGQACPADHGVPGVIHLIGTYEDDFETALIENVMAGGDSAARGIAVGAVLGARNGLSVIPERWRNALTSRTKIETLL
jgi:ADP-ribosylglycohydrolase